MANYTPDNLMGWMLRLKVKDAVTLSEIFYQVIEAERLGKNVTEVMKKVEEKYGIDDEVKWS